MEVCLLWLDELDDVVFVIASLCHRLRRVYLVIGLLAALTLGGVELALEAPRWASALAGDRGRKRHALVRRRARVPRATAQPAGRAGSRLKIAA